MGKGVGRGGGQDGYERKIEVIVKMQKKSRGRGRSGVRVDVNEELKLL